MARTLTKSLMAGCAVALAVGAVGYSKARVLVTPPVTAAVVAPNSQSSVEGAAVDVAAFVTSTRTMAKPAVATLQDIARTETIKASLSDDSLGATPNAHRDDLIGETVARTSPDSGFELPQPMMRPRPKARGNFPVFAQNAATIRPRPALPRPLSTTPKISQVTPNNGRIGGITNWSTGVFR